VQFVLPHQRLGASASASSNPGLCSRHRVDPKCQSSAEADKENPHKKIHTFFMAEKIVQPTVFSCCLVG